MMDVSDEPLDISGDEVLPLPNPRIQQLKANAGVRIIKLANRISKETRSQIENGTSETGLSGNDDLVAPMEFLEHDLNAMGKSVSREEVGNMSLDQVIRTRNIIGPPKRKMSPLCFDQNKDPCNSSLDEFIPRQNKSNGDKWSRRPSQDDEDEMDCGVDTVPFPKKKMRKSFDDEGQVIVKEKTCTPRLCIKNLSAKGFFFEFEVFEMQDETHEQFHKRRWRVVAYEWRRTKGKCIGIGESQRKALAKESAILDILSKLRESDQKNEFSIPLCEIPKGARISPLVIRKLSELCEEQGLSEPHFKENLVRVRGHDKYEITVIIGQLVIKEIAFDVKFAKLGAAKKAYDALSQTELRYDDIIKGDDCLNEDYYKILGTEEMHTVTAFKPPPKKPVTWESCLSSAGSVGPSTPIPWTEDHNGTDGRDTPKSYASVGSLRRHDVATICEPEMPPILAKIRQRRQQRKLAAEMMGDADSFGTGIIGVETGIRRNPFASPTVF